MKNCNSSASFFTKRRKPQIKKIPCHGNIILTKDLTYMCQFLWPTIYTTGNYKNYENARSDYKITSNCDNIFNK